MILNFPFLTASFDADARAFVNTSGATDRAAINHFVKGIKRLGLWSSMVCWPLRSTQNAGTGTTAYSLGGLGTYNGTLVNGPTWGSDGITFDGTNDYINTNFTPSATDNVTVFAAAKRTSGAFGDIFTQLQQTLLISRNDFGATCTINDPTARSTTQGQIAINETATLALQKLNGQGPSFFKNGNLLEQLSLSGVMPTATEPLLIACRNLAVPGVFLTGSIPFALYHNASSANTTPLYALYKSTLGQGLGLP
jgi:hypothetical protein